MFLFLISALNRTKLKNYFRTKNNLHSNRKYVECDGLLLCNKGSELELRSERTRQQSEFIFFGNCFARIPIISSSSLLLSFNDDETHFVKLDRSFCLEIK